MIGRHPREVVDWRIKVNEFIAIIAEEIAGMIETAEGNERIEQIGTTEEEVAGMEATQ